MDRGAEHHAVAAQHGRIDHLRAGEPVLDVHDLRLDVALTLLGGMVFGILGEVAVGARLLDILDHLRAFDGFEALQVRHQPLMAFGQHRHLVDRRHNAFPSVPRQDQRGGVSFHLVAPVCAGELLFER